MSQPPLNHRRAKRLLIRHGYVMARGGRHGTKMVKDGGRPVILPRHGGRDYGQGLTHAIIKQAGLGAKEGPWMSPSSSNRSRGPSGPRSPSYRDASPPAER